ncbi:DUF1648 domain-containing protein [Corynebacterium frankenforstense]|uniref:DUF1648 domain-containing protein n=1 Tax=Corynebacterium frankenforstense TaxID=1230998 RepID=UPI0026EAD6CA|nr:DUF1648 domain-containing protein [Corynebacterium frankenforstense]
MTPTTRHLVLTTGAGALVTVGAAVWSALLLPRSPDPAAVHFGPDGVADGFATPWVAWAGMLALNVLLLVAFVATARVAGSRWITATWAFSLGVTSAVQVSIATANAGLADAAAARLGFTDVAATLLFGMGVAVFIGLVPPRPTIDDAARTPAPAEVPAGGAVAWAGAAVYPAGMRAFLVVLVLAMVALTIVTASLFALGATALTVAAVLFAGGWRLRADSEGLHYTGVFGWPDSLVPAAEIESAEVFELRPGQWGGWGYRTQPGATALVTRGGTALRLKLTGGRTFAATCSDPEGAAAVLNRYAGGRA